MNDIFRAILVMSVSGSIIALLLYAIKPLINSRISKSAQYYLWIVVIMALIVPVSRFVVLKDSGSAPIPVAPIQSVVQQRVISFAKEPERQPLGYSTSGDRGLVSWDHPVQTEQQRGYTTYVTAFIFIYPFSAIAVLLYHIIAYSVYIRKLRRKNEKTSVNCAIPVYRNVKAATPMLIGLFNPAIVFPDCEYSDEQLNAILRHEMTHLRRKDILVKWLSVLACSIHWFNPIVWLSRREIDRMCELACDEAVLRGLDTGGKQCYGETLIFVAAENNTPRTIVSTTMCEEKKTLMERLDAIMKSKKRTRIATIVSVLLIAAAVLAACALGASAENAQEGAAPPVSATLGPREELGEDAATTESIEGMREDAATLGPREGLGETGAAPGLHDGMGEDEATTGPREGLSESGATPGLYEEIGEDEFAFRSAIELEWAVASADVRRRLAEPAYVDSDMLCYVQSVNGPNFKVRMIARQQRDIEMPGEPVEYYPYVMFSSENDPIHEVFITPDAQVELLYFQQDSHETESMQGSLADIAPGSIISFWGTFSESERAFFADRIVVWTIRGDVTIPTVYQNQLWDYLYSLFLEAYSPYYDGLMYKISNYEETLHPDGSFTATFFWTMYHLGNGLDIPSDLGKEQEANWSLQATARIESEGVLAFDSIQVSVDNSMTGPATYVVPIEDFFPDS